MTTHIEARALAEDVITERYGKVVGGEAKALAGVGLIESCYGDAWKGPGKRKNNITAIQEGKSWTGDTFEYTDTHPNADGTSTPYKIRFRAYPTPRDGWKDAQRVVFEVCNRKIVRAAAQECDWFGVSKNLYTTRYYEGWGKTPAIRIANHHRSLARAIALADGAVLPHVVVPALPPTVRRGDRDRVRHGAVWQLQMELRLAADGAFGPVTLAALTQYQAAHGLKADGVCGPKTWTALFADDYIPEAA